MKKTGELLKQKRESASLTLSEVALATKINPKVLTAIENGDEGNLPAKTFLKGFVRSYALFLKMDVDEVLRCFVEDTGGPPPAQTHEAYQNSGKERRAVSHEGSSGLRTAAVIVITLLIGAIIGVRELVDKYQREKMAASTPADVKVSPLAEPKSDAKPEIAKAETPKAESSKADTPKAEATKTDAPKADAPKAEIAKVESSREPVAKDAPALRPVAVEVARTELPFESRILASLDKPAVMSIAQDLPRTLEAPVVEAVPVDRAPADAPPAEIAPKAAKGSPEPAGATSDAAVNAATAPPPPTATVIKNEVIIEALDQVQVKVSLGGEIKSVALAPNDVYTLRSTGAISLDVSDGGAISLVHNGRVQGVPGKLGEPKQVKLP